MDNVAFLRTHPRFLANEERRLAEARAMLRTGAQHVHVCAKYGPGVSRCAAALEHEANGFPAGDKYGAAAGAAWFADMSPKAEIEEEPES